MSHAETTSGTIAFIDPDFSDTHTASVEPNTNIGTLTASVANESSDGGTGTVDWTFTATDAELAFLAEGQTETETFTVDVTDGQNVTVKQDVSITLTGVNNDPPVAVASTSVNVDENATASAVSRDTGVLGNDTDPDSGDAATLVVSAVLAGVSGTALAVVAGAATVAHGTYGDLSINADGTYSYTPNDASAEALAQGVTADDVFTYTAMDTSGAVSNATLTFHITGTDDPPVAAADVVNVNEDATASATTRATGVLANDTDPDAGDSATMFVSLVRAGTGGPVAGVTAGTATMVHGVYGDLGINADGTYSYTPSDASAEALAQGVTADDAFTYTLKDSHGETSSTTLTFHITGQNDAPVVASADRTESAGFIAGGGGTDALSGVIHFTDVDLGDLPTGSASVASIAYTAANGNPLTLTPDQTNAIEAAFSVTPAGGNTNNGAVDWNYSIPDGALAFLTHGQTVTLMETVTVSDGNGGSDTSTVTVVIHGPDHPPVITSAPETGAVTLEDASRSRCRSANVVTNGGFESALSPAVGRSWTQTGGYGCPRKR